LERIMRPFILALALVGCAPETPPEPRLAYQRLDAPFSRGECRNHQYIVIETDTFGVETEIDEGRFCDITENSDPQGAF
jgi:hypothetical protein